MKKIIYITILLNLIFLISCAKEIEFNDQDSKPRLVVHSVMNEQDTLFCILSQSVSVLEGNILASKINNADIKFYENNVLLGNLSQDFGGLVAEEGVYFFPNLNKTPGKTYKIVISHPNFETVQGEFVLSYPISNLNIDTTTTSSNKIKLDISFNDNPSETNYYGIYVNRRFMFFQPDGMGENDTLYSYYNSYICTKDMIFVNGYQSENGELCASEFLLTDKNLNGSQIKFNLETYKPEFIDTLIIGVISYSESMFKSKISLEKYNQTNGDFFAEPVQVYTNIENGYGIFGGFSILEKTIVITP